MAIYEYRCGSCNTVFTLKRNISQFTRAADCLSCGGQGEILPSVFASPDASRIRLPGKEALRLESVPSMGPEELINQLGRVDIFYSLSPQQLRAVGALAEEVAIPEGQAMFEHGQPGEALFAILEGQIELTAPLDKGVMTIRVVGPGESVPLACLVGEGRLITSGRAMSGIRALRLPRQPLLALCANRPDVSGPLYKAVAEIALERYRNTLGHLTETVAQTLVGTDFWANV